MISRRDLLVQASAAAALALTARRWTPEGVASAPLKVLILGGTGFIGPHIVRELAARGHQVTIFTRGRRNADLPAGVERLVGDRAQTAERPRGDLQSLEGRRFDAVFDDSATDPRWVRATAEVLKDSGRYLFVSSTGVFLPYLTPRNDESAPVITTPADSKDYGVMKAQSEQVVREIFGDRALVVRPGYIVGPGDRTDRFSYWPQRFAAGGEVLVPGKPDDVSQFVDVRDLVTFMVKLVEEGRSGTYNATGPAKTLAWGDFVKECHRVAGPQATPVWVGDAAFLREHKIVYAIPWMLAEGDNAYHLRIDNRKAVAAGLKFRPMAETIRDTLADWPARLAALPAGQQPNFRWITPEREREVLAAWKARG